MPTAPAWDEVRDEMARAFPDLDQSTIRQRYEQARELGRARLETTQDESLLVEARRRSLPFVSTVENMIRSGAATRAQQRYREGASDPQTISTIVDYEDEQRRDRNRSLPGQVLAGAAHIPAILGETYATGGLFRGGAAVAPAVLENAPRLLSSAGFRALGGELATGAGRAVGTEGLGTAASIWGRNAAQTALMPSMYGEAWAQRASQANRDPLTMESAIRDLPPAFAMGYAQVAVLGSLARIGNSIPGHGLGPGLSRVAARTVTGMAEQQAVDAVGGILDNILPETYQLKTRYGLLGSAMRGEWGQGFEHAAVQASTFAAFSILHPILHGEPEADSSRAISERMKPFQDYVNKAAAQGMSKEAAAKQINDVLEGFTNEINRNPTITREQAGEYVDGLKVPAAIKEFARSLAESLPVKTYGPEAMGGNRPQPSLSDLARPVQPSRPQTSTPQEQTAQPQPSAPLGRTSPINPRERLYAEARSKGLSDQAAKEYAERTVQEASRPTEQAMTPEQANSALATEQARIDVEGRNARPGTTQPEQPLPVQDARMGQNKPIPEPVKPAVPEPVSKDAARQAFADHVTGKISREEVNKAAKLSEREAYVFWERLDAAREGRDRTLDSIGQEPEIGVTRERVRQIEKQAMSKLGLEGQTIDKLGKRIREMSKPEAKPNDGEVKRSGYEETQDSVLENKLNAVLERISDKNLPPQEQARLFKEYERIQAAIEKGHNEANRELTRAGEKPLTPEDYREIDSEAGRRADATRRTDAGPADAAKSAAADQPIPPAGFGRLLTDAERNANLIGGAQEDLGGNAPKRKLSQTALANEATDAARKKEGKPDILREAAESNPEVWNEAMRQVDADKTLPDRLVEQIISGDKKVTTVEENAILLRERVALSNERGSALADYLRASKQEQDALKKGMDTTALKAKMKEADARDKALSDKADRLDQAIVSTGSEWGRAGQFRRQLVAEDYSLGNLLGRAEKAAKRPLTSEEKSELHAASEKIKELQGKLDEAENKLNESGGGSGSNQYPAWIVAKIKAMQAKGNVAEQIGKLEWGNLSTAEKAAYVAKSYMVAAMTSGVKTLGKIGMASAWQIGTRPAMEAVGSLWNKIPGFREIAAKADVEGRSIQPAAEVEYAKSAATQGLKDAWKTIFDGKSDLDLQYAVPRTMPRTWAEYIGNLHAAEKAPAVRAAFERAFKNIEAFEKAAGRDVTSVKALEKIGQRAYQESQRAKFQEDNLLVKKIEENISSLKKSDNLGYNALGHTADFLMPIRKTPINILADALQYVVGVPRGIVEAKIAWSKGLENLSADQANHIMRLMKKGTLGIPMLILGYWLSKNAGGYYDGRRRDDELKPGEIKVGNLTIPSWATSHHPAFMALQVGAAMHRAEEHDARRNGGEASHMAGAASGLGHMLEEAPFIQEQREVVGLLHADPNGVGRAARSRLIPQLIQWTAEMLDRPGRPQPQGFGQQMQMGIPGARNRIVNRRY